MIPVFAAMMAFTTAQAQDDGLQPFLASDRNALAHARAVSLDVRGRPLSIEEVDALLAAGELDAATLDAWLASPDFGQQVVRHHQGLFLNNVVFNIDPFRTLRDYGQFGFGVWYSYFLSPVHRGTGMTNCTDYEADVNELNQPQSWRMHWNGGRDEGAVDVQPWWDMDSTIRVCAYDAQLTEVSAAGNACDSYEGQFDTDCGCGPNLIWCTVDSQQELVREGLSDAISQRVLEVVNADEPYSEILTDPSRYVNGPMIEYYRNRSAFSTTLISPVPIEDLPDIAPDAADTWVRVEGGDHLAGALTEPGWLLRFQTNRGRANRFFTEFLCGEFIPPESGIMEIAEENPTPDLSQKPVCMDCHTVLEPWAAYWGRWQEVGTLHYDPADYPAYSEECAACGPNCQDSFCRQNYLMRVRHPHEEAYFGTLKSYVFLIGDAEEHPDFGPALWADEITSDGRLARCAAEKAAIWLLGRPEQEIDPDLINGWAADFSASGLSYRALIRSIVTSPAYRSAK